MIHKAPKTLTIMMSVEMTIDDIAAPSSCFYEEQDAHSEPHGKDGPECQETFLSYFVEVQTNLLIPGYLGCHNPQERHGDRYHDPRQNAASKDCNKEFFYVHGTLGVKFH